MRSKGLILFAATIACVVALWAQGLVICQSCGREAADRYGIPWYPTLDAALKCVDAGIDGLVVEGAEGGGFKNPEEVSTLVLLQAIRARWRMKKARMSSMPWVWSA